MGSVQSNNHRTLGDVQSNSRRTLVNVQNNSHRALGNVQSNCHIYSNTPLSETFRISAFFTYLRRTKYRSCIKDSLSLNVKPNNLQLAGLMQHTGTHCTSLGEF